MVQLPVQRERPKVDTSLADDEVWFFCYQSFMAEPRFSQNFRVWDPGHFRHRPRYACQCEDAYVAWSMRGLPYLDPCHLNLLILGLNDDVIRRRPPRSHPSVDQIDGTESLEKECVQMEASVDVERLWQLCSPGIPFVGEPPPLAEGVVWKLKMWEWEHLLLGSEGYVPARIPALLHLFENGDLAQKLGNVCGAVTLIAKEDCCIRPDRGDVVPVPSTMSQTRLRRIMEIAALSQPYQGHHFLTHNFGLALTPSPISGSAFTTWRRRTGAILFQAIYSIPYFLIVFPLRVVKPSVARWLGSRMTLAGSSPDEERLNGATHSDLKRRPRVRPKGLDVQIVEATNRFVWKVGIGLERAIFGPLFGSGWTL